ENDFAAAGENKIRMPWEISRVEPEAESHAMDQAADNDLRFRVLGPNPAHPLTSFGGRQGVHTLLYFMTITSLACTRSPPEGSMRASLRFTLLPALFEQWQEVLLMIGMLGDFVQI